MMDLRQLSSEDKWPWLSFLEKSHLSGGYRSQRLCPVQKFEARGHWGARLWN